MEGTIGMAERIQKLISSAGVASRRTAEEMIRMCRVHVNGVQATLGQKADPFTDVITIDGKPLPGRDKEVYIMLNKPRGYVTTMSDEKGRLTVKDLVEDVGVRVYPVGRLDMDSEGLLIMTNDGELANRIMHPSNGVCKTYIVYVKGENIPEAIEKLSGEIVIDGVSVKAKDVTVIEKSQKSPVLSITIGEGRNRQIRKMCNAAGLSVLRLQRISEGELTLDDLKPGKWRHLSPEEIKTLKISEG